VRERLISQIIFWTSHVSDASHVKRRINKRRTACFTVVGCWYNVNVRIVAVLGAAVHDGTDAARYRHGSTADTGASRD
jgi:hypothetical protein